MKKNSRGLSKSTKILLIAVLVLISIGIIFLIVRSIKNNPPEENPLDKYTADLEISEVQIINYTDVSVKIEKGAVEGEIDAINFIFYDDNNYEILLRKISLDELEKNNFQAVLHISNTSRISAISIAPVFISESGNKILGKVEDEYEVPAEEEYHEEELPSCILDSECEDNNICTTNTCLQGICSYSEIINCVPCTLSSECEDSNVCTANKCSDGKCSYPAIPGCVPCISDSQCKDNNSCTNNICFQGRCSYITVNNCKSCTLPSECEDNNSCTNNTCSGGVCSYPAISGCKSCTLSSECNDNNSCTNDNCSNNKCVYSSITGCVSCISNSQCEDNNNCTTNTCSNGVCSYPVISGCKSCTLSSQCNDNNACTTDSCTGGRCINTNTTGCKSCTLSSECEDNKECTTNTCSNGMCSYPSITSCIHSDGCCPTGCNFINDNNCRPVCPNGYREGTEKCDGSSFGGATCAGVMGAGYTGTLKCFSNCSTFDTSSCVASCSCPSDGRYCTTDICNSNNVCQHIPINNCCKSNSECEDNDICTNNVCVASQTGTCNDKTQNNGETGIDCGGNCDACAIGNTYYVAPNGNDNNLGTFEQPWATWQKAFDVVGPGDLVYIRGGVYPMTVTDGSGYTWSRSHSGTPSAPIRIFNYPGEKPTLDCKDIETSLPSDINYGLTIDANNIHMKGLTVRNVLQKRAEVMTVGWDVGSQNVLIENSVVYNTGGPGFRAYGGINLTFLNCDSYNNSDPLAIPGVLPGNRGYGFYNTNELDFGATTYYKNCRAWKNGDDGFAFYDIGYVEVDGCWSYDNGQLQGGGSGYKLGFTYPVKSNSLQRTLKNSIAANNRFGGILQNLATYLPVVNMNVYNNLIYHTGYYDNWDSGAYGIWIFNTGGTDAEELRQVFKNNIDYDDENGVIFLVENALYTHDHNTWDTSGITVTDADFVSLDVSQLYRPRKADGSLPDITFGHLRADSDLINKGTNVGLPFSGSAPDLGAFEYQ